MFKNFVVFLSPLGQFEIFSKCTVSPDKNGFGGIVGWFSVLTEISSISWFVCLSLTLVFVWSISLFMLSTLTGVVAHDWGFFGLFYPAGLPRYFSFLIVAIEIVSYLARVVSLSVRLFANMMSGHALLKVLSTMFIAFIPTNLYFKIKTLTFVLSLIIIFFVTVLGTFLDFGPQYPAAHGVLRLSVSLNGEFVRSVDPNIGFLHRGTQKLIEYKNHNQALPGFTRLDFASIPKSKFAHSSVKSAPGRAKLIKALVAEMTIISEHLSSINEHTVDVGALTPFWWGFREREQIMIFRGVLSGVKLPFRYIKWRSLAPDLPDDLCEEVYSFFSSFTSELGEINETLSFNELVLACFVNVGVFSARNSSELSFNGPFARTSGVAHDIRKNFPYSRHINFPAFLGFKGKCYDHCLWRIREMLVSSFKILRILRLLRRGVPFKERVVEVFKPEIHENPEAITQHFKFFANGYSIDGSFYSSAVSRGSEFGVFLETSQLGPYACKIRADTGRHSYNFTLHLEEGLYLFYFI